MQADNQVSGVVSRVLPASVQVAFEESEDVFSLEDDKQYRLTKLANDVTYRRMKRYVSLFFVCKLVFAAAEV